MIAAHQLRKLYGGNVVLDGVSLTVPGGQCLALLGPNGAGKTTLLRILATLLRPTTGTLRIDQVDALREPERVRPLLSIVAHGSHVYEDLTARENLRFWETLRGGDPAPARLLSALTEVELDNVADVRVRTFSAGMKRRLALARVLLGQARVLLLDEPFTGLDRRGRKWVNEFLLGFKARGGAAVLATHSFDGGLGVADRVCILGGGRVLVERPAGDLSPPELHRLYESLTDSAEEAP